MEAGSRVTRPGLEPASCRQGRVSNTESSKRREPSNEDSSIYWEKVNQFATTYFMEMASVLVALAALYMAPYTFVASFLIGAAAAYILMDDGSGIPEGEKEYIRPETEREKVREEAEWEERKERERYWVGVANKERRLLAEQKAGIPDEMQKERRDAEKGMLLICQSLFTVTALVHRTFGVMGSGFVSGMIAYREFQAYSKMHAQ